MPDPALQPSTRGLATHYHRWIGVPGLVHGVTTREAFPQQGKLEFFEMIRLAREARILPALWIIGGDQVHGDGIVVINEPLGETNRPQGFRHNESLNAGQFPDTDALIADFPGILLVVQTADCLPLLLVDVERRMVGIAHCGWRGLKAGLAGATARRMIEEGAAPEAIEAWIGPCIRAENYEVGRELVEAFSASYSPETVSPDGKHLDLPAVARAQLMEAGLSPERIGDSGECTFARPERYHSYRRDGGSGGRMLSFIGFDSPPD